MLADMNEAQIKALECAQRHFNRSQNNPNFLMWREECQENLKFRDGKNHWPAGILALLRARGQDPIIINKIKPILTQIAGLEINTRYKFSYGSHSFNEEDIELAKGLTHLGYFHQSDQNYSYYGSIKSMYAAACGIGWTRTYRHRRNLYYKWIHSELMVYDADDMSPQLTEGRDVHALHPMTREEMESNWPKMARRIKQETPDDSKNWRTGNFISEVLAATLDGLSRTIVRIGEKPIVVESQYRVPRKFFRGMTADGFAFSTFDEEKAQKMAESKKEIQEEMGEQIMRTVWYGDLLLDHAPLDPDLPNLQNFSYIPQVWSRRFSDLVPSGIVEDLKDLQREVNYRKLKQLNSLDSYRMIADANAFPDRTEEEIRQMGARSDAVLFKTPKSEVDIIPNMDMAAGHQNAQIRNDKEIQQVSGIFSDSLGEETNATSGVAIRQRQLGTNKNLAPGFDGGSISKKREGQMLLDLLQTSDEENIFVPFLDEGEQKAIFLNTQRTHLITGKKEMINDIRTFPVSVNVERSSDFDSSPEKLREIIQDMLKNPNAPWLFQNIELLKLMQIPEYKKIAASMQQNQPQGGGTMPMGGQGMPQQQDMSDMGMSA